MLDLVEQCEAEYWSNSSLRVHFDIYITEKNKIRYKSKNNTQEFYFPHRF